MPTELAVSAQGLSKTFAKGGVRALSGFDLEVPRGSVMGLLGPNGAGKTTAVRILSTVLRADSGSATVAGFDVAKDATKVRRRIGLAGQYAAVDENLTGAENLNMVGRLSHLSRSDAAERATALLAQFNLTDAGDRVAKTYSGGMRRRLDLAAALVHRPEVLFLDEPTTGLDPQSRNDLWEVIEQLVDAGTTVLLTTQYLEEADRLASSIVVIDHGQVIARGTPSELKSRLGETVLSLAFGSEEDATRAVGLVSAIGSKAPALAGHAVELTVEDGPRAATEALRALDQVGLRILGLELRQPTLDDVFLELTGHRTEVEEPEDEAGKPAKRGRR